MINEKKNCYFVLAIIFFNIKKILVLWIFKYFRHIIPFMHE